MRESDEWYTPGFIVEAARATMGSIDLDPASCAEANETVRANHYFTMEDNGIGQVWYGNVFMNHPFGSTGVNQLWINNLVDEYLYGDVEQAICLTWLSPDTQWFEPLLQFPRWTPPGRLQFVRPKDDDRPVYKANRPVCVTYMGVNVDRFYQEFAVKLGGCVDVSYETIKEYQ